MRHRLVFVLLAVGLLAATPVAATTATWVSNYVLPNTVTRAGPYVWIEGPEGFATGAAPSVGGAVFPSHAHDTTVTIQLWDRFSGYTHGTYCESVDGDGVCSAADGDRVECIRDGALTVAGYTAGRVVTVKVWPAGWAVEGCHSQAAPTYSEAWQGQIRLIYG